MPSTSFDAIRDASPCSAPCGPSLPTRASGLLPLDRTPCYLWSLAWRETNRHPQLHLLLARAVQAGRTEGWLTKDPQHDWLPDIDLAELRGHE